MNKIKNFNGDGLYTLVKEGLETDKEAQEICGEIASGEYGSWLNWKKVWKKDDNDKPIEGTYKVYQKIMHESKLLDVYNLAKKTGNDYVKEHNEYKQNIKREREITNIDSKINFIILLMGGMIFCVIATYGYYIMKLSTSSISIYLLTIGLMVIVMSGLNCAIKRIETRSKA